jgi:hypothetical protein
VNIYSAFAEHKSMIQAHLEHLEDGGLLVLRPGREGEIELVMQRSLTPWPGIEVRYPAPHTPQIIEPMEARGLLENYRGEITQYL